MGLDIAKHLTEHAVIGITGDYLALDGSNANQDINIGAFQFTAESLYATDYIITKAVYIYNAAGGDYCGLTASGIQPSMKITTDAYFKSTGLYLDDYEYMNFGTADDANIYYNGTNLILNPKQVGSGKLVIQGNVDLGGNNLDTTGIIDAAVYHGDGMEIRGGAAFNGSLQSSIIGVVSGFSSSSALIRGTQMSCTSTRNSGNVTLAYGQDFTFSYNPTLGSASNRSCFNGWAGFSTCSIILDASEIRTYTITNGGGIRSNLSFQGNATGKANGTKISHFYANQPSISNGTITDLYAFYDEGQASANVTTAYGFYGKTAKNVIALDNGAWIFGAGQDCAVYYDGTDMIIDPSLVGSGDVLIGATANKAIDAGAYKVGGTAGISATITTAALTPGGAQGSMTFVNGILTAQTQAT